MVDPGPLWLPRLVAEALETGEILAELAAILAEHSRTVCEDGTARTPEVISFRVFHSFQAELASEVGLVPGLKRVAMVGLDLDGRVFLMHSLFSIQVNVY